MSLLLACLRTRLLAIDMTWSLKRNSRLELRLLHLIRYHHTSSVEECRRESTRRPVGKLPGIHATTPLTYKYADDRGQVFTPRRSFSTTPAKKTVSILEVKFWTPERLSSYIFSLPWFYVPTNFQYETLYILYSRPTPFPPSLHADWSDMMNSCAGSSDIFVNLRLHDFQLHLPGLYHFAFKFFVENRYRYLR